MFPDLQIFVSNVVMRIPSYNGDFEEPWYWADYGTDLYTYSFYTDKYSQTNDVADFLKAESAKSRVPSSAVNEFIWRRARNHNITMRMLERMGSVHDGDRSVFEFFYTTLDDSAEYGFNIREAAEIKNFISSRSNFIDNTTCPVYPGADEVHLTMLAKYAVERNRGGKPIRFSLVFKNESTASQIPSYEGQPMIDTLYQQIYAAGGEILSDGDYDVLLLVNNFEGVSNPNPNTN